MYTELCIMIWNISCGWCLVMESVLKALKLADDGFPPLECISPADDEIIYPRSTQLAESTLGEPYIIFRIPCGSKFSESLAMTHRALV